MLNSTRSINLKAFHFKWSVGVFGKNFFFAVCILEVVLHTVGCFCKSYPLPPHGNLVMSTQVNNKEYTALCDSECSLLFPGLQCSLPARTFLFHMRFPADFVV